MLELGEPFRIGNTDVPVCCFFLFFTHLESARQHPTRVRYPGPWGQRGFLPSQANWWTARRTFAPDPAESDCPASPAELAECFPPAKVCASLV